VDFTAAPWQEALRDFLLRLQAARDFYPAQLTMPCRWAERENIPLDGFGKRIAWRKHKNS